jgi:hypothetical protein
VHGVHTLLWLLDYVAGQQPAMPAATTLKAQFRRMLYVGENAAAEIVRLTATALRARVLVDGVEVVSLTLGFGSSPHLPQRVTLSGAASVAPPSTPADLSLDQMEGRSGRLQFATPAAEAGKLFPHAAGYLGVQRIAALACTSCLVGMVVPGLHSMFGGIELCIDDGDAAGELQYAVTSVDARFGLVTVAWRRSPRKLSETSSLGPWR